MCLAALAIDHSRRFPLVLAANRDEFFERPTARLGWWTRPGSDTEILSGRDLSAGGTWFGLTAAGKFGLLTNIRDPSRQDPQAPSRGQIIPDWLTTTASPDRFWVRAALTGHNGFNLIAADFAHGDCWWLSSARASPVRLESGVFALSNGLLDEPWPKVRRLKQQLGDAVSQATELTDSGTPGADALAQVLLNALTDTTQARDEELPSTGVPRELERALSPAFIRTPDGRYGTRCSTVLITERIGRHLVTQVYERSYPAGPGLALMRRATLKDWPPRYQTEPVLVNDHRTRASLGSVTSPVLDAVLDEHDSG
ncbi:MAG: hypothetical protein RL260_3979, partial [Pseudomonadota bacterium]